MTISHDSFLERAPFINSVASSRENEILPGSKLLSTIFSLASSKAGNDVSIPDRITVSPKKYAVYATLTKLR